MTFFHLGKGLVPAICCICQTIGHHEHSNLCKACQSAFIIPIHQCSRCALPLAEPGQRCGNCLKHPPAFDSAFSALLYQPPASHLIQTLKQGVDQTPVSLLSGLFCEQLNDLYLWPEQSPAAILPLPLHWRRYLYRGYNQSLAVAQLIGKRLGLPVSTSILKRSRHSLPQQGLPRSRRLHNLNSAFIADRTKTEGKTLILLDDVITTGATMNAAATALKLAGATSVIAWSLARTARP